MVRNRLSALLALLAPAPLLASDDAPPLYVTQNGQRMPTVVMVPPAEQGAARHALLQVPSAAPEERQPSELGERAYERHRDPSLSQPGLRDRDPESHFDTYYGGYPVSAYRLAGRWDHGPWDYPGWGYVGPGWVDYPDTVEELYRAHRRIRELERQRRFNERDMRKRKASILNNFEKALQLGLEELRAGEYGRAVVALTMATRLNQGDPASRIHLAQTRLALGQYEEAAAVLRRGLELQPKLAYLTLNLEDYYPQPGEFYQYVDALRAYTLRQAVAPDVHFLLGYMEFQRGEYRAAYESFRQAARGLSRDDLVERFLEITRPPR